MTEDVKCLFRTVNEFVRRWKMRFVRYRTALHHWMKSSGMLQIAGFVAVITPNADVNIISDPGFFCFYAHWLPSVQLTFQKKRKRKKNACFRINCSTHFAIKNLLHILILLCWCLRSFDLFNGIHLFHLLFGCGTSINHEAGLHLKKVKRQQSTCTECLMSELMR